MMCIATMVDAHRRNVKFHLSHEDADANSEASEMNNNMQSFPASFVRNPDDSGSKATGKPREMKKSLSFSGYETPPRSTKVDASQNLTIQELETLFDSKKKEPSKISKQQIKMYSQKYRNATPKAASKPGPWYKEIMEHTQPAHLAMIFVCVYLAFRLFPDSKKSLSEASTLVKLLYLSSFSAVFGTQFWMTFVSGLALFFNVPRHVFGQVQAVTFPLYFLINAVLMLIVIITYTQQNPTYLWDMHQMIQGGLLVTSFFSNFIIRIYLAPVLSKLITIKMAIEKEAGMGMEIATSQPGSLSTCPHYMKLHRAFRRTHVIIAAGNMIAMAATSMHLYYLATKLCLANA